MITPLSQLPSPLRIRIAGFSGSGKSVLGKKLSKKLSLPHLEEDAIHFTGTDFTLLDKQQVLTSALEFTSRHSSDGFITDGNWADLHPILMPQVNVMIELVYPLRITFWRLIKRTFWRCWTGEKLWGTETRETFAEALAVWKSDNIFTHTVKQWYKYYYTPESRGKMRELWWKEGWVNDGEMVPENQTWKGERLLLRFRHPRELDEWLNESR
ncbi:UNVERIFIED_CONTAM: hypothetical protein HDU68_005630 [Siphonaria sp. JEL0065]|nr:hypothetical protein HDU68_005630 [Siphonaria sp. JEL0065]